jgi:phosphatidylinositol 4-kinase
MLLQTVAVQEVVRSAALRYLDNLLTSFPSLVCDLGVVTVMLELLTVLRHACLDEFTDEVSLLPRPAVG